MNITRKLPFVLIVLAICLGLSTITTAQDLRASLFSEVDQVLQQTNQTKANLLSPRNYKKGMELYQEAERDLKRGSNIQEIREKLEEATSYFNKAREATKLAQVTFANVLAARNDAMEVEAANYATDKWREAEKQFRDAAEELESGDARDAKKGATTAENLYRNAELTAIKSNILTSARNLLKEADRTKVDKRAPLTFDKAQKLVEETESALEASRYDMDQARTVAKQAEYEARHSIFLDKYLKEMDKKSREEMVLQAEEPLRKVADQLLITSEFDKGFDQVVDQIIQQIAILNDSIYSQQQEIERISQENQNMLAENSELRTQLENLTDERLQISKRVEAMNQFRDRFNKVNSLFSKDEARIMRDQNDAIIRLMGLNFDIGSSVIKPSHFGLLTKVKQAIDTFPGCTVIIEGHTDSRGSDEVNLKLSEDRAKAVMSYLLANMDIEPLRLEAIGFGEGSPIANNETEQGRTLNRRIDIIIKPRIL